MLKAALMLCLLCACPGPAPSEPLPAPDGGINVDAKAYTYCSEPYNGVEACGTEHEIIKCGYYKYQGSFYYVWTTDGSGC